MKPKKTKAKAGSKRPRVFLVRWAGVEENRIQAYTKEEARACFYRYWPKKAKLLSIKEVA